MDSKAECVQLNVVYDVARKKYMKKKTKTNRRQYPLSPVHVKIREGSPEGSEFRSIQSL